MYTNAYTTANNQTHTPQNNKMFTYNKNTQLQGKQQQIVVQHQQQQQRDGEGGVVWVNKRYIPIELRSTAPVPRHKFLNNSGQTRQGSSDEKEWMKPIIDSSVTCYKRGPQEYAFHKASPASQCQEWSTLRQMLPSKGAPFRQSPPQWGTNPPDPPTSIRTRERRTRFPIINSPMTSYADAMHVTNRMFTFH